MVMSDLEVWTSHAQPTWHRDSTASVRSHGGGIPVDTTLVELLSHIIQDSETLSNAAM